MVTKVGINGFGRIGRVTLRAIRELYHDRLEVVAINARSDTRTYAHLFKFDSIYGRYRGQVSFSGNTLDIDGHPIKFLAEKEPSTIPWKDYGVDIVIESTGKFNDMPKPAGHLNGGAKKVIVSAPSKGADITLVLGINEKDYDPARHHVISNASCTTNGIAPVAKVLNDHFGLTRGFLTTIHSYTNDQKVQDQAHKDLRRARAAAVSLIPTTTGAAKAVAQVLPALKGKLDGIAVRAPVATVSMCDFVAELARPASVQDVNAAFKAASGNGLRGILEYSDEPCVSVDFCGSSASSIVDAPSTMSLGGNLVKVFAWYDNEWGYSCRLAELAEFIAEKGL
jgi:glyceraldehyde 3-phosphate dehydrogenase